MTEQQSKPRRRPDVFVIGAAKSGTTSVYEWLKAHPDVYMSPSKEPRYFAPDLYAGHPHDFQHGVDEERYLDLFAGATREKRLGEASPRYIYSTDAPRLIHEFQPQARIIALVRNPVEMIYSLHNQRVSEGIEDITDFEAALAAEEDRRAGRRGVPPLVSPRLALYRDQARFAEQLGRWLAAFSREQVHIILFDDLANEPAETYRDLLEFLDVDPAFKPASFAAQNLSWTPRSKRLRALTQARPAKWLAYQAMPRLMGQRASRRLTRAFRYSPIYRRPKPRSPLSPELRRQLEDELAPDVARLGEIVGRDLRKLWFGRRAADVPTVAAASEAG
ncbi:hypothetical protein BH23CHL7_BH23CHL7_11950 [soil metagenome]